MTNPEPPDPRALPEDDGDGIDDPTGVHALLSSLPEPGPMPEDLVARIGASLREEADRRERDETVSYALFAGRTRAQHRGAWLRVAAVAAIALVVGAGLLAGTGNLGTNVLTMIGGERSTTPAPATSAPATTTDGGSAPSLGRAGTTGANSTGAPGANSTGAQGAAAQLGAASFHLSGTAYTAGSLRERAQALAAHPPVTLSPGDPESPHLGPIATPLGLASCLTALDLPANARAVVDLATYDGRPVAVIVTRHGDSDQVRVVRRNCGAGNPELVAGPYPL